MVSLMEDTGFEAHLAAVPTVTVGGLPIAVLGRAQSAQLMIDAALRRKRGRRPLFLTSANGEVLARCARDRHVAALFREADLIAADGQPMVLASRLFCSRPLPERVATTDLFHDVAARAEACGVSFYLWGASEAENRKAVQKVRLAYPELRILGSSHGYLEGSELEEKIEEVNRLQPDIVWLSMGVPLEQRFVHDHADRLSSVGVIKTAGGLLNFLSGSRRRAPRWMQAIGLEWLWRLMLEPHRLLGRYLLTNPVAVYLMVTKSR